MNKKIVLLKIYGADFKCVNLSEADFNDFSAIYVILCVDDNGGWKVLDVGQTGELGDRIDDHDRKNCWDRECSNRNIWVCYHKMPTDKYTKQDRLDFEEKLRNHYNPPCGKK